ncbi:MAG: hypothetical protein AAF629_17465 [Chloroflexota bacterium]
MQTESQQSKRAIRQIVGWGCGLTIILGIVSLAIVTVVLLEQERETARYPGSIQVAQHSNYNALPREFRWDDSYRTSDPFPQVYNWYSSNFNLGPEARANGNCIMLYNSEKQMLVERYTGVMLCDTVKGRMIFVTRSMTFRN